MRKQTEASHVVCRHAPDDVLGSILDAHFRAGLIKVVVDRGAQKVRCPSVQVGIYQCELNFGNKTKVRLTVDQDRIGRNESGVAAHELYEPDVVGRGLCLGVGRINRAARFGNRGLETKSLLNEGDIIVDRFRNANYAEGHPLPIRFFGDFLCTPKRVFASDNEAAAILAS
jgi:hypothetical protein